MTSLSNFFFPPRKSSHAAGRVARSVGIAIGVGLLSAMLLSAKQQLHQTLVDGCPIPVRRLRICGYAAQGRRSVRAQEQHRTQGPGLRKRHILGVTQVSRLFVICP